MHNSFRSIGMKLDIGKSQPKNKTIRLGVDMIKEVAFSVTKFSNNFINRYSMQQQHVYRRLLRKPADD
jgi:hypothetical protein